MIFRKISIVKRNPTKTVIAPLSRHELGSGLIDDNNVSSTEFSLQLN
jgi:hypothetical protein